MPKVSSDDPRPEIIDMGGALELFCDTIVAKRFGETTRLYLGRASAPDSAAEVTCIAHIPSGAFVVALYMMARQFLPKKPGDGHDPNH